MCPVPRTLARRLGKGAGSSAPGPRASEKVRRRVLEAVRGDGRGDRADGGGRWRSNDVGYTAGGIVIGAAIVLAVALGMALLSGGHVAATPGAPVAQATLRKLGSRAELVVSGMPEPPIGEVYEVWLESTGRPPRATDALFSVASDGSGTVDVPGTLRGVREVMVTAEPLGGSAHPTSLAVLRVAVPGR